MPTVSKVPTEVLRERLLRVANLPADISEALGALVGTVRDYGPDQDVVRQGDSPSQCFVVVDGWVSRNKVLGDGRRQITALHYPGAVPDLQSLFLPMIDHNITTLGPAIIGFIPHAGLSLLVDRSPKLVQAFWRETLIEASVSREWEINLGSRSAVERIAHLLCEVFTRLDWSGEVLRDPDAITFHWPITQTQLGEAVGISSVHVNRSLQELRLAGLIGPSVHHSITILDMPAMLALSGSNPDYLVLERPTH